MSPRAALRNKTSVRILKGNSSLSIALGLMVCALNPLAWAREATTHETGGAPCAVLANFSGDVEVLDPSRTRIASLTKSGAIPCGGWVTTGDGWAIIHHRDGYELRVGPGSFMELPEVQDLKDQAVLYRGEVFGSNEGAGGELRVATANGRARLKRGSFLINYSAEDQDTQLVALDAPASLENRFEIDRKVVIKPGEATSLNFKMLRVLPEYPKAVSIASLRGKLSQFHLTEKNQSGYYETAQARAERRIAVELARTSSDDGKKDSQPEVADRKIASDVAKASARYTYAQNPLDSEETAKLKAQWVKKMTAGEDIGEKILYPDKFYGKPQKVKLMISDPAAQMNNAKQKTEDAEKDRLIQELSEIRE